jgi:AraC-like DNA-binding protein
MISVVSFTGLPTKDQFDSWCHVVSQTYVPLVGTAHTKDTPFGGELVSQSVGSTQISEVSGGACSIARTIKTIRQSDPGLLKLGLQLSGYCVLTQDGRETALAPGDFALYDTQREYQLSFDAMFRCLIVMFPRDLVPLRVEELNQFTARRLCGRQGVGGLVAPLLLNMGNQMRKNELSTNVDLSSAVIAMLAVALAEQLGRESRLRPETHRDALTLRVKAFVDAQLYDPGLTTSSIAKAHNISPRYLQKLFEAQGITVTDWIRRRRLEHCRVDLLDPRLAAMPVSDIAARWGLNDPSNFSRLFKSAFGASPREFRKQAGSHPRPLK